MIARTHFLAVGSAAAIFAGCGRHRPVADAPREGATLSDVMTRFDEHHTEVKATTGRIETKLGDTTKGLGEVKARLDEVEQRIVREPGDGMRGAHEKTWGETLTGTDEFKAFAGRKKGTVSVEVKALSSLPAGGGGSLVAPDVRTDPVLLPQRKMTVRALVAPGTTASNQVWYPRMVTRNDAAAPVVEDPSAPKPMSSYAFAQATAPVQTIAHWIPVSAQLLDDAPALASILDSELRYGLADAEETQLLFGDGTGVNLLGIMPQASAFDETLMQGLTNTTAMDRILMASAQAELALLPASGVVFNPLDYAKILALKDTQGRYLAGGPLAALAERFWNIPKVTTVVMPKGTFLIGAFFDGAQIFDRQEAKVLVSTEDRDNFVKNMVTCLAEERLAFAVKRPAAFIKGPLTPPA